MRARIMPIGITVLSIIYLFSVVIFLSVLPQMRMDEITPSIILVFLILLHFIAGIGMLKRKAIGWLLSLIQFIISFLFLFFAGLLEVFIKFKNYGLGGILEFPSNRFSEIILLLLVFFVLTYLNSRKIRKFFGIANSKFEFTIWEKPARYIKTIALIQIFVGIRSGFIFWGRLVFLNSGWLPVDNSNFISLGIFFIIHVLLMILGGIGLLSLKKWGWGLSLFNIGFLLLPAVLILILELFNGRLDMIIYNSDFLLGMSFGLIGAILLVRYKHLVYNHKMPS